MIWKRCAGMPLLAGVLLAGCTRTAGSDSEKLSPPPPAAVSDETRERLQALAPDALIGRVAAVLPESNLAAVSDIAADKAPLGTVVTFYGSEERPIASGTVIRVVGEMLHVQYADREGGRDPVVGDLAIHLNN